jgi:hypothetical protein
MLKRHIPFLLALISISSSSALSLRHHDPGFDSSAGMLASIRPVLESNPTKGENRFPKRNPFTSSEDDVSTAPPVPFQPMNADTASYGISSVDSGHSFPIGSPLISDGGYPLLATPDPGVPNLNGVTKEQEDNLGDTSPPNWKPPKSAA